MTDDQRDHPALLRLLECWLPLAQELNAAQGWGDDARALEALIHAAAPALGAAESSACARAILLVYHTQQRHNQP